MSDTDRVHDGIFQVVVNGLSSTVVPGTTLGELVRRVTDHQAGIAVALNAEIVPRSHWDAVQVQAGDRVEVLTAAAGG